MYRNKEVYVVFSLLKPKQQSLLGIDVSSSSIKIIQLSTEGDGRYCVEGYGMRTLPEKAVEGALLKDINVVADTIRTVTAMFHLTSKQAAISVPDSLAISKVIQISEGLTENDIEELVVIEADKYIPYPIDEINIDFSVIGPSAKSSALEDVLIVASRAEIVNSRVEALRLAGIETKIVDVDSYVVERVAQLFKSSLPAGIENKVVAIIDIGGKYSHLYVLQNMKVIYSRDEEFGGNQLVDSIVGHYNMSSSEAVEALNQQTLPEEFTTQILQPFYETLYIQVKRALQFFFSTSRYSAVDHIVLVGGIAKQAGIAQLLEENLHISTSIGNPLASMSFAPTVDKESVLRESPTLMVACGLALRHIE
jgi:type IV pilus assembly protein PilM